MDFTTIIVTIIGIIATFVSGFTAWHFGGKHAEKRQYDNESHNRELDLFNLIDGRAQKESEQHINRLVRFARMCDKTKDKNGNISCPILNLYSIVENELEERKTNN